MRKRASFSAMVSACITPGIIFAPATIRVFKNEEARIIFCIVKDYLALGFILPSWSKSSMAKMNCELIKRCCWRVMACLRGGEK